MYYPALRPAPLAFAIALALCSTSLSAQNVQNGIPATASIQFNIAAKPLGEALSDWALQARTQLIVQPELTRGKMAPAVSGNLPSQEALRRLLAGSGLTARIDGDAVIIVDAATNASAATLPEIAVTAQTDASTTTENSGTYAARAVSIFKGQTSLREIPQSVSVLTRQQIEDQNLVAVEDAINKMTGARISDFQRSESVYVRGYTISKQVDGAPMQSAGVGVDMALYDRIELLRGPSGLLTGTGNPGGVMNFVLKRPQAEYAFNATGTLGSASNKRGEVDVTGPLTEDGALRGRLVMVGQDKEGFTSFGNEHKQLIYGALEYVLSPATKVGLSYYYQRYQYYNSYGVPLSSTGQVVARGSYVGTDRLSTQTDSRTTVDVTHQLGSAWEAHAVYSHANDRLDAYSAYASTAVNANTGRANYSLTHANNTYAWDGADAYVTGPVSLFKRDHVVTLGYSYSRYEGDTSSKSATGTNKDVLNDHNYDALIASAGLDNINTAHTQTITTQSGLYASSRIKLADPLTLVLGARWTDYSSKSRSVGTTVGNWTRSAAAATDKFSPYGGLVWDVNRNLTFYGSYADIFVPQTAQDYQGNTLAPRVGWQGEVGAKTEWFDGALNATLALYRIRDTNRSMTDPDHVGCGGTSTGTCYKAAGLVQSQGWEFEVTGKPTPHWDITAGYTYNQATYLRDSTASNVGATFAWPKHLFKLWNQYRPGGTEEAAAWTFGAGMNAQSEIVNGSVRQGGYATLNARIGYRIDKNWDLSLNLNNLTDRSYLRTVGYTGYYNSWGDPRNVQLIARAHF